MKKEKAKRIAKRITAFAAAAAMAAAFTFPAEIGDGFFEGFGNAIVASASDGGLFGDRLYWYYDSDDGTLTISYRGTGDGEAMPDWENIFEIPWPRGSIKTVVIGDGVTSIGKNAFYEAMDLTSITIPDSVTSIGDSAFFNCPELGSVTFGTDPQLNSIGKGAFYGCTSLTSITIPDSVTSIGDSAFFNCGNLTSVNIPSNVQSIGDYAFDACSGLTYITVDENNPKYSSTDGVLFNKAQTTLIQYPSSKSGNSYSIPSGVDSIGDCAFRDCGNLTSIDIPDSVNSIGVRAFYKCENLTSITIPDNVTSIGSETFRYCSSLTSITIPSRVTSIGNQAFSNCDNLKSIFLPEGADVTSDDIPDAAAKIIYNVDNDNEVTVTDIIKGSQTSVTIPDTIGGKPVKTVYIDVDVNVLGSAAKVRYYQNENGGYIITNVTLGSGQTSFTIPDTIGVSAVASIGNSAFSNCTSLETIFIPDGFGVSNAGIPASTAQIRYTVSDDKVTITRATAGTEKISLTIPEKIGGKDVAAIGDSAFADCTNLEKVTLPDSIISIGNSAFIRCTSLSSTNIPNGVTSIGENAFISCSSLGSITIPSSVTSIGRGALNSCSSITVDDSNPNYSSKDGVLFNKDGTILIAYPINKSGDSYIIPNGVKSIEECAFLACKSLTSITIPDSVTSIGDEAFLNCSSLTSITIPDSVIFVGEWAFLGCTSLESVFLPNDLNVINADIPDSTTKVRYTIDNDGNVTITEVNLNDQTSVDFPDSIGGKPVASVCIKEGTTGVNIPDSLTQVSYTVDSEGNVTITEVSLGDGQTSFDIPETIGGDPVTDIADGVLEACPDVPHTHREKTAATCTEKPVCAICVQEYDEALGHDHSGDWQNDADDHWKICPISGCNEIIDKEAHDFDSGVVTTEPTEETEGVKTYTCGTCKHTKTEPVAKLDHTHKPATEYSSDKTGHWYACSGCTEKVDFESHTEDSGTVTKEPTATTEGEKTFKCTKCDYVIRTEPVAKLDHTHKTSEEYSSDASGHWYACSGCDEKVEYEKHTEDSGTVTKEPTATTKGEKTYKCVKCGYVMRKETIPATGSGSNTWQPSNPPVYIPPVITPPTTSTVFTVVPEAETKVTGSTATINWNEIENADKYVIYQYKNGRYVKVMTTTDTSVTFKKLKNGETYKFLVRYTINGKLSPVAYSEKITVRICYKPIPKATTAKNSVKLSWGTVSGAEKYAIYRYMDGKAVKLTETKKLSVKIGKLSPDTEYKFIVRAYVDGKWTTMKKSDIVTVKTKAE